MVAKGRRRLGLGPSALASCPLNEDSTGESKLTFSLLNYHRDESLEVPNDRPENHRRANMVATISVDGGSIVDCPIDRRDTVLYKRTPCLGKGYKKRSASYNER